MKTIKKASLLFASLALVLGAGLVGNSDTKEVKAEATQITLSKSYEKSFSNSDLTITFATGSGNNAPKWYGAGLRLYNKNTITVKSNEKKITKITFNWEKQGSNAFASATANVGDYSHPTVAGQGIWIGSSDSITFTLGTSGQLQLNTLSYELETSIVVDDAQTIIDLINGIGQVEYTDACYDKIKAARNAYDSASTELQAKVTNLYVLEKAEKDYNNLKANDDVEKAAVVEGLINALPNPEDLTDNSLSDKINEAYDAYNALTDDQKGLLEAEGAKIKALIEKLKDLPLSIEQVITGFNTTDTFTFEGIVTNVQGGSFYLQQGDYAILVYNYTLPTGVEVGKKAKVTATLQKYNGLIETNTGATVTISDTTETISPKEVSSIAELKKLNHSVLFSLKGLTMGSVSGSSGKRTSSTIKLGDETIPLNADAKVVTSDFYKKLKSCENMTFDIVGANVGYFNSTQIAITSINQIVVHADQFIADWATLRANGGEDGICYYLSTSHRAEMEAMLTRYEELSKNTANKTYIDATTDVEGVTIGETITYLKNVLAGSTKTNGDYGIKTGASGVVITSNNSYDKTSLIALFAILGIVTISGYYIIEKKKFSK